MSGLGPPITYAEAKAALDSSDVVRAARAAAYEERAARAAEALLPPPEPEPVQVSGPEFFLKLREDAAALALTMLADRDARRPAGPAPDLAAAVARAEDYLRARSLYTVRPAEIHSMNNTSTAEATLYEADLRTLLRNINKTGQTQ